MSADDAKRVGEEWHKAKVFSLLHLVATVGMIFTVAFFIANMQAQQRQTQDRLELHIQHVERKFNEADARHDREIARNTAELNRVYHSINRLEAKIDRLIESRQ